jgi:DNA (cytosine-5)-methyltransferase 1
MLRSTPGEAGHAESGDEAGRMADSEHDGLHRPKGLEAIAHRDEPQERIPDGDGRLFIEHFAADALKGHWGTADWLFCTDGKWRPVEAGTFPLADGTPCRLGRLRGYGDAINAQVAKAFIESYMNV